MTVQTAPATRSRISVSPLPALVGGIGAVFLVISALGPTWLYSPAVPAAHIPALSLSYADLNTLANSGHVPSTWVQENYFAWIGWLLIIATILATGAAVLLRQRRLGFVGLGLSALGLVLGLFAAKGALSWSQFSHQIPNLRVGAYLLIVGFLLTLVTALLPERR